MRYAGKASLRQCILSNVPKSVYETLRCLYGGGALRPADGQPKAPERWRLRRMSEVRWVVHGPVVRRQ
jgi:hypothetical protein